MTKLSTGIDRALESLDAEHESEERMPYDDSEALAKIEELFNLLNPHMHDIKWCIAYCDDLSILEAVVAEYKTNTKLKNYPLFLDSEEIEEVRKKYGSIPGDGPVGNKHLYTMPMLENYLQGTKKWNAYSESERAEVLEHSKLTQFMYEGGAYNGSYPWTENTMAEWRARMKRDSKDQAEEW